MTTRLLLLLLLCADLLPCLCSAQTEKLAAEIKWVVPAESIPHAMEVLTLKKDDAKEETVWFFDTKEQALRRQHHLVLRARRGEKKTDSTVKLRLPEAAGATGAASSGGKVELDWGEATQALSRSEDAEEPDIPDLKKVLSGEAEILALFPAPGQQELLAPVKDLLRNEKLRRYGPVQALVWKNKDGKPPKVHLDGYDRVTVELWHLKNGDKEREILEVSIKTEGTREEIGKQAEAFFAAVRKQLPGDTSKTGAVLEFFAPGK